MNKIDLQGLTPIRRSVMSVLILLAKSTSLIIGKIMYYHQKTELRGQLHQMATAINAERFLFSDTRERICNRFQGEGN